MIGEPVKLLVELLGEKVEKANAGKSEYTF